MFYLSWRQLIAKKRQTLLILLGITFGTMLFISISGIQLGFRQYITEQLLNNTSHILITGAENNIEVEPVTKDLYGLEQLVSWLVPPSGKREESKLENYYGWYERLRKDPNVFEFSPRLSVNALIVNGKFNASAGLAGVVPDRYVRISSIEQYMQQGQFSDLKGGANKIILGSGVAKNVGVRVGQYVRVSVGKGDAKPFKVVGVLHFGNKQVDDSMAFAEISKVQALNLTPGRVSGIAVSLYDMDKSTEIAQHWQLFTRDKVEDWRQANRSFMEMIRVQDFVRFFIMVTILLVASFGIYNVLTIMIAQKKREIAILRAIGYPPRRILALILYQGLLLGFAGAASGVILGYLLCVLIESIDLGIEIGRGRGLMVSYDLSIYVTAFVAANIAALIASYLPALSASRMTPMDIIRSES